MNEFPRPKTWSSKFSNAFAGITKGIRGQNSFYVHIPSAIAVITISVILQLDAIRLSLLLLCIGIVMTAELFNSSLESLATAITREENPSIGDALDIASGAVLGSVVCAVLVGAVILLPAVLGGI